MDYKLNRTEEDNDQNYLKIIPCLEAKLKTDPQIYQHSTKVAVLSLQLLKMSNLNINETLVYHSALFHDIGKTVVPPKILKKKLPLSSKEFKQIQEHSKQGFRILQHYNFPSEVLFAALLHHEKNDGTGYPIGFVGREIPIIARIVHICDVFEALTADRPHRKALSIEDALKVMEASCGTYDPELYSIFVTSCL